MIEHGSSGRPLGLCLDCDSCSGWTRSPRPPQVDPGAKPREARRQRRPWEARGRELPSLCDPMPRFDGERFIGCCDSVASAREAGAPPAAEGAAAAPQVASQTAPAAGSTRPPAGEGADAGAGAGAGVCGSCGCPEERHEVVGRRFGRFLAGGVPAEALHWSQLEVALWGDTGGLFRPAPRAAPARPGASGEPLVSVICPTTAARRHFHPLLWLCFSCQCHEPRELVVVDTCEEGPADFFVQKMREDRRLVYRHYRVPEGRWSVGLKRNLACYFASGEVIAHFDDDDLYASCYLAEMLRFLRSPRDAVAMHWQLGCGEGALGAVLAGLDDRGAGGEGAWGGGGEPGAEGGAEGGAEAAPPPSLVLGKFGAACAKLSSWHTLALRAGAWSTFDALQCGGDAGRGQSQLLGWGFSLVYLRAAWERAPFLHIGLGEDFDFVACLRRLRLPVVLAPDARGICAHTHHDGNTTGGCSERRGRKLKHVPTRLSVFAAMAEQAAQGAERGRGGT